MKKNTQKMRAISEKNVKFQFFWWSNAEKNSLFSLLVYVFFSHHLGPWSQSEVCIKFRVSKKNNEALCHTFKHFFWDSPWMKLYCSPGLVVKFCRVLFIYLPVVLTWKSCWPCPEHLPGTHLYIKDVRYNKAWKMLIFTCDALLLQQLTRWSSYVS